MNKYICCYLVIGDQGIKHGWITEQGAPQHSLWCETVYTSVMWLLTEGGSKTSLLWRYHNKEDIMISVCVWGFTGYTSEVVLCRDSSHRAWQLYSYKKKDFQGNRCHQDHYSQVVSSAGIWDSTPGWKYFISGPAHRLWFCVLLSEGTLQQLFLI